MPATIIGRVPGLRNVPFNVPVVTQTGGSTFQWVGETGSKPVGELAFTRTTLGHNKVAGIVVLSEELVRFSNPGAEETVRRDLVEQCAKFLDETFIQVAKASGREQSREHHLQRDLAGREWHDAQRPAIRPQRGARRARGRRHHDRWARHRDHAGDCARDCDADESARARRRTASRSRRTAARCSGIRSSCRRRSMPACW